MDGFTQNSLPHVVSEMWTGPNGKTVGVDAKTGRVHITDVIGDNGVPISEFHMGDMHMPLYPGPGVLRAKVNNGYYLLELEHVSDLLQVLTPEESIDFQRDLQSVLNIWGKAKGILTP